MKYRIGTCDDVDDICYLIVEAINNMENMGIYQWDSMYPTREDFLNDIEQHNLLVVEDNHEIVAIYVISQESDKEYSKCQWKMTAETACILHRFCISPKHQNKGLGKQILCHIEKQAKEMSFESIRLDVYTKNPYALKLYKKNNYEERGYANWRKGSFLLMEKKL